MEYNVEQIIKHIGEDSERAGLIETPKRVVASWKHLFSGYKMEPASLLKFFKEEGKRDQIVILRNIQFYSMCEHHILPFYGTASIAYIPKENEIIGVSKLARILDCYARRLQVQERIGAQVVDLLMDSGKVLAAACFIDAVHMCIRMRGVENQTSSMVTSALRGNFMTRPEARNELMFLLQNKG